MGIPDHLTCLLGNMYAGQDSSLQEIHVATLEESGVRCFPSSRGLTTWVSLEWDPEIRLIKSQSDGVYLV